MWRLLLETCKETRRVRTGKVKGETVMEKCPKCGNYTYAINTQYKVMECLRMECRHTEPVDVEKYLAEHNALPKLYEAVKLAAANGVFY